MFAISAEVISSESSSMELGKLPSTHLVKKDGFEREYGKRFEVFNQITEFDIKYGCSCTQNSKRQASGVVTDLESLLFRWVCYSVVVVWVMSTRWAVVIVCT